MKKLQHIHPGRILLEEFLEPMELTQYRLAKEIHEPQTKISQIIRGLRGVTPETGLKLDKFFGFKTEGFFYGLQVDYNLSVAKENLGKELSAIRTFNPENPIYIQ